MPSPCELRPAIPDHGTWTAFVDDHPESTVFHTRAWCAAVDAAFAYDPAHRFVYDTGGDDCQALVPGFVVTDPVGRTTVNPFCEYGYPLLAEDADEVAVLRALAADVGTLGARTLKDARWRGPRGYNPAGYGATETGAVIRLAVDRPFDDVRVEEFSTEARRALRVADEADLIVREGDAGDYYPLYLDTMRRLGSPQFPPSFFETLADGLGDDYRVYLADREGEAVGGLLALDHGDTRTVWSNASLQAHWDVRPNHRLYAAAIADACADDDLAVVDFGRSRPGSSVHDFKTEFGGTAWDLASFVTPPHRAGRASLAGYGAAAAVTHYFSDVITNRAVGPRLKRFIHE